jgi:amino acid transporter
MDETSNARSLGGSSPVLRFFNVFAIALAAISPTTSVFLVYGEGLDVAGTGVVWAFVIAAVIAISMAFSYAELGSVYPGAGGAYTIVQNVLGRGVGFIAVLLFLVLGVVITATILVAATYLHELVPVLPVNITAVAMMIVVTFLSLERIGATSWVAAIMLVVEMAVILGFIVVALFSLRHPLGFILNPVVPQQGGGTVQVGWTALLGAVVPALFAYNGYDWPLYFAEETSDPTKTLPRAVMVAALTAIVSEVLAVGVATLAIPDLHSALESSAPLAYVARTVAGGVGSTVLLAGVVVAMFDTGLSGNLAYARIYFASARNNSWPGQINRFFGSTNRYDVPKWGLVFLERLS